MLKINLEELKKMANLEHEDNIPVEIEITFSEPTTKDYQLVLCKKSDFEEKMKIDQEEFEKMTELEKEWELFRRAEHKEQLEKWIKIKTKLAKRKKSNDASDCKN